MSRPRSQIARRILGLGTCIAAAGFAACSGSSTPSAPRATPTSTSSDVPCAEFILATLLVYPSPGATGIPANAGDIIVSGAMDGTFVVGVAATTPIAMGTTEPVPSPAPTALQTGDAYGAVPIPTLSPATTYTVTYRPPEAALGPCPHEESGTIGTFTTSS